MKYLKPKQEYIDLYDKITIEDCRRREKFHRNSRPSEKLKGKVNDEFYKTVSEISLHFDLLYTTIKWHEDKEKTINEWIERDSRKDELYENAEAPEGIRCLQCHYLILPSSKILYDLYSDKKDRVLFMYDCPNKCNLRRAFFDDGEEYKIKPSLCPKCNSILEIKSERIKDKKVITKETCSKCSYTKNDEFDLTTKPNKPDPDYEKDKERFCLSGENLEKNIKEKFQLEGMAKFMDDWKEKEKLSKEYDVIKSMNKLTVISLENLLVPLCEKNKYVKFQFGTPDIGKDLILPFTAQDANPERKDMSSSHDLQRVIKIAVEDTNWRLMSDGISYRMGILSGRLRAYEREEDLIELAKQSLKKHPPKS